MYVTRSYHIWKEVQLLPWLERNVQIVLDRVDAKDPMVKNMENLRATLYSAKPPLNIHRHLLLSDMSDTIAPPIEVIIAVIFLFEIFITFVNIIKLYCEYIFNFKNKLMSNIVDNVLQ